MIERELPTSDVEHSLLLSSESVRDVFEGMYGTIHLKAIRKLVFFTKNIWPGVTRYYRQNSN